MTNAGIGRTMARCLCAGVLIGFIHALTAVSGIAGELALNRTFSDNMVLQRNRPIPVFGAAPAGTEVTVQLDKETVRGTSSAEGVWRVELPGMSEGGPYVLTVSAGEEKLEYRNVLIGDIWVCAGQSNMNWPLQKQPDSDITLAEADRPKIRFFRSPTRGDATPQLDFGGKQQGWVVCSPETAGGFSGLAYHFATQIKAEVNVPVGIIQAAQGGSFIESWIPRVAIETNSELKPILEQWEWLNANRTKGGKFPSPVGKQAVSTLYNEAIHPHIPRPIKGVVWYQGESNTDRGYQYRILLRVLVESWRDVWHQPDLPFVVVQLPNYDPGVNPFGPQDGGPWEIVRESQATVLDLSQTALAVTLGMGMDHSVHPPDKRGVATRVANCALQLVYSRDILASEPRYVKHEVKDDSILVTFSHVGTGLKSLSGSEIVGFTIAGDDKVFYPAQAEIVDATTVRVFSKQVPSPQAVRHAWSGTSAFDLANSAGIPASTFRTDDWEVSTQKVTMPYEWLRK